MMSNPLLHEYNNDDNVEVFPLVVSLLALLVSAIFSGYVAVWHHNSCGGGGSFTRTPNNNDEEDDDDDDDDDLVLVGEEEEEEEDVVAVESSSNAWDKDEDEGYDNQRAMTPTMANTITSNNNNYTTTTTNTNTAADTTHITPMVLLSWSDVTCSYPRRHHHHDKPTPNKSKKDKISRARMVTLKHSFGQVVAGELTAIMGRRYESHCHYIIIIISYGYD